MVIYRNLSDEDLLHQIATKQDKQAFDVLFERYNHLALGVCLKYFSSKESAIQAVGEIFQKIWAESYRYQITNFKTWFYQLAKKHCFNNLRSQGKIPVNISPGPTDADETGLADYLNLKFKEEDVLKHLNRCMQSLTDQQYKCIQLFYLRDKNFKEIAARTGFSVKEVMRYIQRGRASIKSCLKSVVLSK